MIFLGRWGGGGELKGGTYLGKNRLNQGYWMPMILKVLLFYEKISSNMI